MSEYELRELERQLTKDAESEIQAEDAAYGETPADPIAEGQHMSGCTNVVNLGLMPVEQWNDLRVSKLSRFGDRRWDWRQEGSPVYKHVCFFEWERPLTQELSLLDRRHKHLSTLLRALLFYCLPPNAVFINVKSFNTSCILGKRLMTLARFLEAAGVYVSDMEGNFTTANDLTPDAFLDFFESQKNINDKYAFLTQVTRWRTLSREGLLPPEFQLGFDVFTEEQRSVLVKAFDESKTPFEPISLETLSVLIPHCLHIIENCAEDILYAYDSCWQLLVTDSAARKRIGINTHQMLARLESRTTRLWQMSEFVDEPQSMSNQLATQLRQLVQKQSKWRSHPLYRPAERLYKTPMRIVKAIAADLGVDLKAISLAIFYDVTRVRNHIMHLATELRNSCAVIIFFTTGMRRSELANIEVGTYWRDADGTCWLRFRVFKTSEASAGDEAVIPIPDICLNALQLMERLSEKARATGKSLLLFSSATTSFGKEITPNAINQFIKRWCVDLGLEDVIHPHRFRKTLAMFFIYQDSRNLGLIKRLFRHRSYRMTLAYVSKLPGLKKEITLAIIQQDKELFAEILEGAKSEQLGGKAGIRIQQNLRKYAASLHDPEGTSLDQ